MAPVLKMMESMLALIVLMRLDAATRGDLVHNTSSYRTPL